MKSLKIVIADDEPLNLMLCTEIFRNSEYTILTAMDGQEAIELAEREIPNLVILDWNMPRMDGMEALIHLKNNEKTTHIPVIMITGIMVLPENLKSALETGAVDFIRKPFDRTELKSRVRSMMLLSQTLNELREKYAIIAQKNRFINSLIESLPHPMVYYSAEGEIIGSNQLFAQIAGQEEVAGKNMYNLMPNTEFMQARDKEMIESGKGAAYENTFGNPERNFFVSKSIFSNEQGQTEGILSVMTDITDLKKAHDEIIDNKKREIASNALRLIQMSEMNIHIISELEKIVEHADNTGKGIIRSLINHFNANTGENLWSEFEMRFSSVNESFYISLQEKFPDLTPNEKKLCALLKLNLSSKDIAAITSQNPQSIDVARYRLRKKLNLLSEENLVDFLMRI
jgi:PAS domain S-box-containing protein